MKLKGFTLTEIIVALAISSLVLISGLTVYYLTFKGTFDFQKNASIKISQILFYNRLQIDMEECDLITIVDNELSCVYEDHSVKYEFSENNIVINSQKNSDTLKFTINNIEFYLDNNTVTDGLINGIKISLNEFEKNNIVIRKKYDAVTYLPKAPI